MELNNKQYQIDERYLKMAFIWASNSKAFRLKVGAIMVKDGMIISDGYNGTPSGMCNCCEDGVNEDGTKFEFKDLESMEYWVERMGIGALKTRPEVLHAESNCLSKAARSTVSTTGATMYITDMPCLNCAKMIVQCGIKRVVYCREYRDSSGVELLNKVGIEVVHHPIYVLKDLLALL